MKNLFSTITTIMILLFNLAISMHAESISTNGFIPKERRSAPDNNSGTTAGYSIFLDTAKYEYDGSTHHPLVTVFEGDTELIEGEDFTTVGDLKAKNAGTYKITVLKLGDLSLIETKDWEISTKKITLVPNDGGKHIEMDDPWLTYTADGIIEGDSLVGITLTREKGESIGSYKITAEVEEGANLNYQIIINGEGTFKIEEHQYSIGESFVQENVIKATCEEDGSYDEVYYCQSPECGAECLRYKKTSSKKGHNFSESFITDIVPTCTQKGLKSRHCTRCYNSIDSIEIPATGHLWGDPQIVQEPTCTQKGTLSYKCLNDQCDSTKQEGIDSLGHDFEENFTLDSAATCEKDGVESRHCTRCEQITEITHIPALGHTWDEGVVKKEPKCEEEGLMTYHCLIAGCEGSKDEPIAPIGHQFGSGFITDTFPTCVTQGSKSKHCNRCMGRSEVTPIPANGHRWDKGDTIHTPSCTGKGVIEFHCIVRSCGVSKTEEINALGHKWDGGVITQEPTCTKHGLRVYTCTADSCGVTKTEKENELGHKFEKEFTIDIPATCITSGKKSRHCERCEARTNATLLPATGHAWSNPIVTQAATCTTKGVKVFSCKHSDCNQKMTQEIDALGHNFSAEYHIDIEPTCTHNGSKSRHCTRCTEKIEIASIPAFGHTDGDTLTEHYFTPTCTIEGSYEEAIYCLTCKQEISRNKIVIPAKGHNWDEGKYAIKPTTSNKGKIIYTCHDCRMTKFEITDKLYEKIELSKGNNDIFFNVNSEGYCPGSEGTISYRITDGVPTEYKIIYSELAKQQGFSDADWTDVTVDSRITISIPKECEAGSYSAEVVFRNEALSETEPLEFNFNVNLDKSYTVAIFEDVVSIDNRENRFSSYQWYHNGELIPGATEPYYQEKGGLTGNYYVMLNIGTDSEVRTCQRDVWDEIVHGEKSITVSPNPMEGETTIYLKNFDNNQHTLAVINDIGTTIITEWFNGEEVRINTNVLTAGNYIITVDGIIEKAIKK